MTDPDTRTDPTSSRPADAGSDPSGGHTSGRGVDAGAILEQIREVVDDLAERAGPTVKQVSAKAAEVIATAADRAAPLAQRAGEVTAEASGKLAERSRSWASQVREGPGGDGHAGMDGPAGGSAGGPGATGYGDTATSTGTTTGAAGAATSGSGVTGGPEFPGSAPADQPVSDAPSDTISNG